MVRAVDQPTVAICGCDLAFGQPLKPAGFISPQLHGPVGVAEHATGLDWVSLRMETASQGMLQKM
jgi:hypothetical protein